LGDIRGLAMVAAALLALLVTPGKIAGE